VTEENMDRIEEIKKRIALADERGLHMPPPSVDDLRFLLAEFQRKDEALKRIEEDLNPDLGAILPAVARGFARRAIAPALDAALLPSPAEDAMRPLDGRQRSFCARCAVQFDEPYCRHCRKPEPASE
jgi:hypothetical protein